MSVIYLELNKYRNFDIFDFEINANTIFIQGKNGTGKTNILESISLLAPGKGLRSANYKDIILNNQDYWTLRAVLKHDTYCFNIDIEYLKNSKKKVSINESAAKQQELLNLSNIIWLTPQMLDLFTGSASNRRKFLDRMVMRFSHKHIDRVKSYEYLIQERMRILLSNSLNSSSTISWLSTIEKQLSEQYFDIAIYRCKMLRHINSALSGIKNFGFCDLTMHIIGSIENQISQYSLGVNASINEDYNNESNLLTSNGINNITAQRSDLIDWSCEQYRNNRIKDMKRKQTHFGAHKSDFNIIYNTKNINAKFCSTGEQKVILTTLVLSETITPPSFSQISSNKNTSNILLLDEIFTHLDLDYRELLAKFLTTINAQKFITTTETEHLEYIHNADKVYL